MATITRILSKKLTRIIGMEFRLTSANKAFVIITLIGPFLIVAVSVLPSLLAMRGSGTAKLAVTGTQEEFVREITPALEKSGVQLVHVGETEEELRKAVLEGEIDGYLVIPGNPLEIESIEYITSGGTNFQLLGTIQGIIGNIIVTRRLAREGLDPSRVGFITRQPQIITKRVSRQSGQTENQDFMTIMFTGIAFTMLIYMTVLLYSQSIARSVLTEKTSKTVEIMLSSVNAKELLFGKILGKAIASLLQYAVWIVMALIFLRILKPLVNLNLSIAGGAESILYLVVFFLLAFFLYSSAYAALGAASEDEQHLGQLSWPMIFFLVLPMVMVGAIATNPGAPLVVALSFFPMTAPIVMFQRVIMGSPAGYEILICIVILFISILGMIIFSAKIFRIGLLMTGKRFSLKEILRWLKYR